ncbi:MAG: hypothetical protein ACKV0T_04770 [Planctomycetales bacterium]
MVDHNLLLEILDASTAVAAPATGERCLSLRCKGMYLNAGLGQSEQVAGDGNFWCAKTQRIYGPDDQLVGDGQCRHAGRGCYDGG